MRRAQESQVVFFFQAEDGIRDLTVTGVQTCALPILARAAQGASLRWDPRSGDWEIRAALPGGPELHVHRVVGGTHEQVLAREVDGQPKIGRASCRERV